MGRAPQHSAAPFGPRLHSRELLRDRNEATREVFAVRHRYPPRALRPRHRSYFAPIPLDRARVPALARTSEIRHPARGLVPRRTTRVTASRRGPTHGDRRAARSAPVPAPFAPVGRACAYIRRAADPRAY